ncbi:AbrB/MazE/SpoVT family DNA-binding domain-containing protein [Paenibacillus sp. SZ31]|uniref:Addiction module antidote protein n=2 Tax=Paenibacillus TaxID=44249 RepID=A0A1R1BIP3_PAEAM|nr:AbrB/MazE/SpoVT family DNA-binding domain-containing protein [Paenibacillus sp. SZ31]OMF08389.1 addiction module antidote protein [Paenibacillus amylolyticus]
MMNGGAQMKEEHSKRKILSRKIGKMGNSLGVSLPKVLIDKLHVSQGDEIEFIENSQGEIVLKKVKQMKIPENVRPEVLEAFFDVFEEDEDILNDLRDR